MLQTKGHTMHERHAAFFIGISLVLAIGLTGCMPDLPLVTDEGKIVGGHRKLNDLLERIKAMRDERALVEGGVLEAVYVASIQPTPQAVLHGGTLPAVGKAVAARYDIMCSSETLDAASIATVTRFLLLRKNGVIRTDTYSVLLLWRGDRWEESPVDRIRWYTKPDTQALPTSHPDEPSVSGPTSRRVFPATK